MNNQSPYTLANRKIDPGKTLAFRPDGTPDNDDRTEIGPTPLAYREWQEAGIQPPNLEIMRQDRLNRLVTMLLERDYAGLLMTDPLNIRYATDSTNMQIWNMHNPFRACLLLADGYLVLWDYKNSSYLSEFNPLVKEVRSDASMFYFGSGDKVDDTATSLTGQIDELMRSHAGNNRRLAVDKIMIAGFRALEAIGIEVMEGEEVSEKARVIKGC